MRSAERASIYNGNVEKGSGSKGLELRSGGEFAVFTTWLRRARTKRSAWANCPQRVRGCAAEGHEGDWESAPHLRTITGSDGGLVHGRHNVAADVHERSGDVLPAVAHCTAGNHGGMDESA
jgi:hypothetical protein